MAQFIESNLQNGFIHSHGVRTGKGLQNILIKTIYLCEKHLNKWPRCEVFVAVTPGHGSISLKSVLKNIE